MRHLMHPMSFLTKPRSLPVLINAALNWGSSSHSDTIDLWKCDSIFSGLMSTPPTSSMYMSFFVYNGTFVMMQWNCMLPVLPKHPPWRRLPLVTAKLPNGIFRQIGYNLASFMATTFSSIPSSHSGMCNTNGLLYFSTGIVSKSKCNLCWSSSFVTKIGYHYMKV